MNKSSKIVFWEIVRFHGLSGYVYIVGDFKVCSQERVAVVSTRMHVMTYQQVQHDFDSRAAQNSQANRTGVLVHKLLTKTKDPEIREELQLFSLQLLHRKVQFTACGFFPLDFTLLYSIVGAVTTYLVILIQFQLSYNDDRNKDNTTFSFLSSSTQSYVNVSLG